MAKKKVKNFKLEQVELKPLTVGIFESRKKSSVGTFLILSAFVLFIFFLPQISEWVMEYFDEEPNIPNVPSTPSTPNNSGEVDKPGFEDSFYAFTNNLKIANEDITLSSFSLDEANNTLTYTITNNGASLNIETLNYYIEIYNNEKTLIERVKLASDLTLTSGAFRTLTKNISVEAASSISYVVLVKKTIAEYPEVNLFTAEDGSSSLVCSKEYEKVTYKFKDKKLKEFLSEVTYNLENLNYEAVYQEHKILVNTYNSKTGIVSTMFEYETGYNITTSVTLENASRMYIFNADSFKLDVEPKVVKFEMEAQGFKCE